MGKKSAFSLVELMVAVGIVGILVTIAFPRYQAFLVNSRRGEAKSNLSHLRSLQAAYKIDHYTYYFGAAMTGANGIGYKDGVGTRAYHGCDPDLDEDKGLCNYLGFQPESLGELRYFYQFRSGSAVASAASDRKGKHIYPDCNGGGEWECDYPSGDALTIEIGGNNSPVVCRNISKYCPVSGGAIVTPTCSVTSCPTGHTMYPYPLCCRPNCTSTQCCDSSGNEITYCESNPYKSWVGHPTCSCGPCINPCNLVTHNLDPVTCACTLKSIDPLCTCTTTVGDWTDATSDKCKGEAETVSVERTIENICTPPSITCVDSSSTEDKDITVAGTRGTSKEDVCTATGGTWGGPCACPAPKTHYDYDDSACAGSGCSCPPNAQETACSDQGANWVSGTCNCQLAKIWHYFPDTCSGECVEGSDRCGKNKDCCDTSVTPAVKVPMPDPSCPTTAGWYGEYPNCCVNPPSPPTCPHGTVWDPNWAYNTSSVGKCVCRDGSKRKLSSITTSYRGDCCPGDYVWRNGHCTCPADQFKVGGHNNCHSGGFNPDNVPDFEKDDPCHEEMEVRVETLANNIAGTDPCGIVCMGPIRASGEPSAVYNERYRKAMFECWMKGLVDCKMDRNPGTTLADLDSFIVATEAQLDDPCSHTPDPTPTP